MASYGVNKVSNINSQKFYDYNDASSYSYTCPAGKRAEVSLAISANAGLTSNNPTEVIVKGVSVFSDVEGVNFALGRIFLSAGESVSITNGASTTKAARGFINALEYEV